MFKAKELMNANVVTVGPSDTVDDAMTLMQRHKISGLAVVDEIGSLLGVVSEYDLLGLVWDCKPESDEICNYMTADVCKVDEEDSWIEVADRFLSGRVRRLPVMRGEKLVGIITRHDLICRILSVRKRMRLELSRTQQANVDHS